jgi:dolichyl-phosphate beta-glucosyltransferase
MRREPTDEPQTSLVFPTYNPGPNLDRTCAAVAKFLHTHPEPWEVLFVCDGCTDDSPARLRAWAKDVGPQVRVLNYVPNRGKGYAVRTGLQAARGHWRVFADVDLAYDFADIAAVAQALQDGADVAIAARQHAASRLDLPSHLQGYAYRRHLQGRVFAQLTQLLLGLPFADTQAGLKGMTAEVANDLLPRLRCNGFGFDCELLTVALRSGYGVAEVPVCVHWNDETSTTRWWTTVRMVRDLWRIRRRWRHLV